MHDTVRRTSKLVGGKRLLHFFHVADTGVGRFLRPATKRRNLAANAGSRTHSHDSQVAANAHEADHHDRDDRFLHLPRFTRRPSFRKKATRFALPGLEPKGDDGEKVAGAGLMEMVADKCEPELTTVARHTPTRSQLC